MRWGKVRGVYLLCCGTKLAATVDCRDTKSSGELRVGKGNVLDGKREFFFDVVGGGYGLPSAAQFGHCSGGPREIARKQINCLQLVPETRWQVTLKELKKHDQDM
jgi:hypothetical protein